MFILKAKVLTIKSKDLLRTLFSSPPWCIIEHRFHTKKCLLAPSLYPLRLGSSSGEQEHHMMRERLDPLEALEGR